MSVKIDVVLQAYEDLFVTGNIADEYQRLEELRLEVLEEAREAIDGLGHRCL